MLKPLPPARFELLFPPVAESPWFRYFQDAGRHPFRPDAAGLEPVNAWWLADASLLAYADAGFAAERFGAAGMDVSGGGPAERGFTQCYVAHDAAKVIVAFRGTEVLRPDRWTSGADAWRNLVEVTGDLGTDARFALAEIAPGRRVHRGFLQALDAVWPAVEAALRALLRERPDRGIWLTGHSLGAALATLAAQRCPGARALYTFGSPMVGDAGFARGFRLPAYRFLHRGDFVPRLPPLGPCTGGGVARYHHVGRTILLDGRPGAAGLRQRLREQALAAGNVIAELRAGRPWAAAPEALNDHAPLLYALQAWNYYAGTLQHGPPPRP